jgi:hypothetical protein
MNNPIEPERQSDPQVVLTGMLKEGGQQSNGKQRRSDIIVFTLPLALLEITFIVTIPEQGATYVPVYAKFRVKR